MERSQPQRRQKEVETVEEENKVEAIEPTVEAPVTPAAEEEKAAEIEEEYIAVDKVEE